MAALTKARDIRRVGFDAITPQFPFPAKMATGVTIYQGGLVAVNAGGFAVSATTTSTRVIGVAEETVTNTGADGAKTIRVRRGCFKFANKAGDLVTQALIGASAYVEDDQTVRLTATASIAAGRVAAVESDGVWVEIF
jgi:hypothetical protein